MELPLVPIMKFQQPQSDYVIHPQIISAVRAVSKQPEGDRSPSVHSAQSQAAIRGPTSSTDTASRESSSDYNVSVSRSYPLLPIVQFSLYYDIQSYLLTLHLHLAKNLNLVDRHCGTFAVHVVATLQPSELEVQGMSTVADTHNPYFDKKMEFKHLFPREIRKQFLSLKLYSQADFSVDNFLGLATLHLADADLYGMPIECPLDTATEALGTMVSGAVSQ